MITLTFWLALIAVIWAAWKLAGVIDRVLMFSEDVQERITK